MLFDKIWSRGLHLRENPMEFPCNSVQIHPESQNNVFYTIFKRIDDLSENQVVDHKIHGCQRKFENEINSG